jgi:hypothetical protein
MRSHGVLICLALLFVPALRPVPLCAEEPLRLHPDNPKYFLFRGKPLVLVTASEHYGSVLNRAFDYDKYLADAAEHRMTLTRTFLLYRELQTPRNPWSPCKPESPDYLAPYPRTGPGKALDGEPSYDLDRWNPEYFGRLRRFLRAASDRGIVVELTLFSHTYGDPIWALNPLNGKNNKQGVGKVEWAAYDSLHDKALVERQSAYARKVVQETCDFDNVYYEVCNEPAGGKLKDVPAADVDAWLVEMARVVRDELKQRGRRHLVFGAEAFDVAKLRQNFEDSFAGSVWDAINVHPHAYLYLGGRQYDLGGFMDKRLELARVRDFCLAVHPRPKPVVLDEDNVASMYRDPTGWTIHRKRAWTAVLNGAHYDYIDFSVTVGRERGTAASRRGIRRWMRNLSEFIHSFDFVHARPLPEWVRARPKQMVVSTLAVEGKDYVVYLADGRDVTDPAAGEPIEGPVSFTLPQGSFRVLLYSPATGEYSPGVVVEGGKAVTFELPPFRHDLVMRVTRLPRPAQGRGD